jgi:hypothetical protein
MDGIKASLKPSASDAEKNNVDFAFQERYVLGKVFDRNVERIAKQIRDDLVAEGRIKSCNISTDFKNFCCMFIVELLESLCAMLKKRSQLLGADTKFSSKTLRCDVILSVITEQLLGCRIEDATIKLVESSILERAKLYHEFTEKRKKARNVSEESSS